MAFAKATKKKAKLKITLNGPAGSGKTYSALVIADVLGGKKALADSEHGRALLYADRFDFDHAELAEFSLDTYVRTINEAKAAGYDVLILDSLSHAWAGKGGALEEVDKRGGSNKFNNGWKAVTPKQNELIDSIRAYPGHIICTMRKKMEYAQEQDERGKTTVKKLGLAPVQRDGVEYEFDFIFDLDIGGKITVTKSSFSELDNAVLTRKELPAAIERIKAWLEDGAPASAKPAPIEAPLAKGASDTATVDAAFKARAKRIYDGAMALGILDFAVWVTDHLGSAKPSRTWTPEDMERLEAALKAEAALAKSEQSRGQPAGGEHVGAVV